MHSPGPRSSGTFASGHPSIVTLLPRMRRGAACVSAAWISIASRLQATIAFAARPRSSASQSDFKSYCVARRKCISFRPPGSKCRYPPSGYRTQSLRPARLSSLKYVRIPSWSLAAVTLARRVVGFRPRVKIARVSFGAVTAGALPDPGRNVSTTSVAVAIVELMFPTAPASSW